MLLTYRFTAEIVEDLLQTGQRFDGLEVSRGIPEGAELVAANVQLDPAGTPTLFLAFDIDDPTLEVERLPDTVEIRQLEPGERVAELITGLLEAGRSLVFAGRSDDALSALCSGGVPGSHARELVWQWEGERAELKRDVDALTSKLKEELAKRRGG